MQCPVQLTAPQFTGVYWFPDGQCLMQLHSRF